VYLVPVNGDRPRMLARGASPDTRTIISLDGKTLLLSIPEPATSSILEFTLPASAARGPAPGRKEE
jgi:hypothetical protein